MHPCFFMNPWGDTKKELIIADELFFVTPTGFKPVTF